MSDSQSPKITAFTIDTLLKERHSDDVYVSQCKTGATWTSGFYKSQTPLLIMDGWAMKKKWARPLVIGYEIKISRGDFYADDKWQGYLPYCNHLYFVCPHGVVLPNELPPDVGLIYVSKTGTKLFGKKKAIFRDVQIPDSIFRYILMSRIKVTREELHGKYGKKQFWEEWLKDKNKSKGFGGMVSRSIRDEIERRVVEVEEKNKVLNHKITEYEDIKAIIQKVGMNPSDIMQWSFKGNFRQKIEEIKRGFPEGFDRQVDAVIRHLTEIRKTIWSIDTPTAKAGGISWTRIDNE